MKAFVPLLAVLLVGVSVRAADASVEDILKLTQKGLGEEVLLATVEATSKPFSLKAEDILRLKDGNVPDKVITAMIRHRPVGVAAAPEVAPVAPGIGIAPVPAAAPRKVEAPVQGAPAFGVLNIENLDDKVWSYRFEPDTQTIWIATSATDGRGNLQAHGGMSIRMPAGTYNVRYNGQDRGQQVTVFDSDKSLLMLSRVETAEVEALYVSVFERGERKASGKLVTLRENGIREDNVIRRSANDGVRERVIERAVEVPSSYAYAQPTYVYSQPSVIYAGGYPGYYGSSYYSGSRYYGGGYYGGGYYGGGYGRSYCAPRYYSSYSYPRYYGGYSHGGYCAPRYSGYGYGSRSYGYGGGHYHRGGGRFSVGVGFRF